MLSRGSNDSAARLRRAKSAPSVSRRLNSRSIPPEDRAGTRKSALTAATVAFGIPKRSPKGFVRPKLDLSFKKSSPVRGNAGQGSHLARSKSDSACKIARNTWIQTNVPGKNREFNANGFPGSSDSQQDSFTCVQMHSPSATSSNFVFDAHSLPGNVPSRRHRGDRSLFKSSPAEERPATSSRQALPSLIQHSEDPRRLSVPVPSAREQQTDEAILAMARDRYLQENQPRSMRVRKSFISPSFRLRRSKSKRSSWQSESTFNQEISAMREQDSRSEIMQFLSSSNNSNKISSSFRSIKRAWRRTFGRSTDSSSGMPVQQVDSNQTHYGRDSIRQARHHAHTPIQEDSIEDARTSYIPQPSTSTISGVGWPKTVRDVTSTPTPDSERYTVDTSRVTSWNDSTRPATVLLYDVDQMQSSQEHHTSSQISQMDSRRLVSALMKRTRAGNGEIGTLRKMSSSYNLREERILHGQDIDGTIRATDTGPNPQSLERQYQSPNKTNKAVNKYEPCCDSGDIRVVSRSDVVSPSVYSERPPISTRQTEMVTPTPRSKSPLGTATISPAQAFSSWSIESSQSNDPRSTSHEWRNWAADEAAGLERGPSFNIREFSIRRKRVPLQQEASLDCKEGVLASVSNGTSFKSRAIRDKPGLGSARPQGFMGGRFPFMQSSRSNFLPSRNSRSFENVPPQDNRSLSILQGQSITDKIPEETVSMNDQKCPKPTISAGNEPSNSDLLAKSIPSELQLENKRDIQADAAAIEEVTARSTPVKQSRPYTAFTKGRPGTLDEDFLRRVRRGPYNLSSTSLTTSKTDSLDSIYVPKRRSPVVQVTQKENAAPNFGSSVAKSLLHKQTDKDEETPGDCSSAFI